MTISIIENGNVTFSETGNINKVDKTLYACTEEKVVTIHRANDEIRIEITALEKVQ